MLATRINHMAPMASSHSVKPYAVLEFDSLIATALSGHYLPDRHTSSPSSEFVLSDISSGHSQREKSHVPNWTPEVPTWTSGDPSWASEGPVKTSEGPGWISEKSNWTSNGLNGRSGDSNWTSSERTDWSSPSWANSEGNHAIMSPRSDAVLLPVPNSVLLQVSETHQPRGRLMSAPISSKSKVARAADLNSSLTNPCLSPLHFEPPRSGQASGFRLPSSSHHQTPVSHHIARSAFLQQAPTSHHKSPTTSHRPTPASPSTSMSVSWPPPSDGRSDHAVHSPGPASGSSGSSTVQSARQSDAPVLMADVHLKPGPNLIKPIAYKPTNGSPARSPVGQVARRPTSGEESGGGACQEMPRPIAMRLGTSMLGLQASPDPQPGKGGSGGGNRGAFNSARQGIGAGGASSFTSSDAGLPMPHPTAHPSPAGSASSALYNGAHAPHHPGLPHLNTSTHSYHNASASSQHNLSANSSHISANSSHISANSSHVSGNSSHISANSSRLSGGEEATSLSGEVRPDSVPSLGTSRLWQQGAEIMLQTPSPSDSGVGELEAMLREKDAEINTLREVMDRNERAIFQVYEERRNAWLHDSQELRDDYERKLKVQSRKSYKTEQVLSLQVYKLQQEQKTLQDEKLKAAGEKDTLRQQLEESREEVAKLREQLNLGSSSPKDGSVSETEASQEEVVVKNKEIIRLKSELHALEAEIENKNKELLERAREASTRNDQLSQMKEELGRLKNPAILVEASSQTHTPSEVSVSENVKPSALGERDRAISSLQEELVNVKTQLELLKGDQDKEREQWLEEKNKVVRYQKQLQLNYVQMQRKNSTLETEVQQLTLELENRDMKLIALSGEESVC
ncbi:leucine zipper putative tumor suppressor 2 isoform X2 [Aplysia californica]|uniref:Leucine zipper putative tumor suppressor 2 isoform X2 n=1 Tax=Aplysia californica TaxID=6500 RepID=A0ABM0JC06_APLCA|nr:leucine zipper putative tumor suppressor 2 isoform X2 [Aplysia californica]